VSISRSTVVASLAGPALGIGAIAPAVIWWGRLRDPIAREGGIGGRPSGSLVRGAAIALLVGAAVVAGLSSCSLALLRSKGAGTLAGVSAASCWLTWCTILANEGAPTWRAASSLPLLISLPGILFGVITGYAVARGVLTPAPTLLDGPLSSAELHAGERVA
jgi:hypothetical protein